MNKATLQRFYHGEVTFGEITFEWILDHPKIYTIELPWRNNQQMISCIPQGLYNVVPHNTSKFHNAFRLLNVPARDGILLHSFNYASDVKKGRDWQHSETDGCIGPGLDYDKSVPMIKKSVLAMDWMIENVVDNWCLEVKNFMPLESL